MLDFIFSAVRKSVKYRYTARFFIMSVGCQWLLYTGLPGNTSAQSSPTTLPYRPLTSQLELGGYGSTTGEVPFWMQTNQYGIVPRDAPTVWLRGATAIDYRSDSTQKRPKVDWGAGLELVGQAGASQAVILSEGYVKARLGWLEIFGGRRKQVLGLAQSPLSSGSFIWSRNALPMPRVQIGTIDYVPIGFTKKFVAINAFFAHGWFGDQPYVQNSYLHQKALSVRLGKPASRFKLYGSFSHEVQWAGYAFFAKADPTLSFDGQYANSLDAYYNVVVPVNKDALKDLSKFTTNDQNRVGDHRGAAEAGLSVDLNQWTLFTYQQHAYDLGRKLYNGRNIEDGLYGLRLQSKRPDRLVDDMVFELFNSQSQGYVQFGKLLGGEPENYLVNGQYPDGWSYQGRTIGIPFITQTADTNPALGAQVFSRNTAEGKPVGGLFSINNNRILAFNWGVSGSIRTFQRAGSINWKPAYWRYQFRASYSQNYGVYSIYSTVGPFPDGINQFSAMGSLSRPTRWLGGSSIVLKVGYDQGKLLRNPSQTGFYLGIHKDWVKNLPTRQAKNASENKRFP